MHYNRKERKNLARQFGLKPKNETAEQRRARVERSAIAGKQIHQQFLMATENSIRNQMAEKDAQVLKSLTESLGAEEAEKRVANNKALEDKRREKLFNKKNNR